MWNTKNKAVTFSYDDGITQDRHLVELLNKYGLKCTFNLNSGIMTGASTFPIKDITVRRMNVKGLKELYKGHEIAVHTLTHPNLTVFDDETIYNEIMCDKENLERLFDTSVVGMAYPYGTYNDRVINIAQDCGIKYARTVNDTNSFDIPSNLMCFGGTCHHNYAGLEELVDEFIAYDGEKPALLYIWGHSYEFDADQNWELIERLFKRISGKDDIYYGTNRQVLLDCKKAFDYMGI